MLDAGINKPRTQAVSAARFGGKPRLNYETRVFIVVSLEPDVGELGAPVQFYYCTSNL